MASVAVMSAEPIETALLQWAQAEKLEHVIVVSPSNDGSSYLERLYAEAKLDVPSLLVGWEEGALRARLDEYKTSCSVPANMVEIYMKTAITIFDRGLDDERVVITYGISTPPKGDRDASRIARFPDPNVSIQRHLGDRAFEADRGHFIAHSAGGGININLFPQRRTLNRGHNDAEKSSGQGRRYRDMERYAAANPGTFLFHRPIYDDSTWIPHSLEYGLLVDNEEWWIETFENK